MAGRGERADGGDAVKVIVRVRPLNAKERQEQTKSCIRIPSSSLDGLSSNNKSEASSRSQQLVVGKDRAFTFDEVFGIDSSQQDVYRNTVESLVDGFLEGYNATVLAYGQTGTGKTHSMSGSSVDSKAAGGNGKSDEMLGIIPRVIRAIFDKMQANQQRKEYSLRVEYIEIYNEELRDLLHPETPTKSLSIREDGEGNIVIAGVKSETAPSKEAVLRLLALGSASRVTGSTMMNEQSSRSHAIFSLIIHQKDLATSECRKAKFHLVDLAGSERAKRTGAVAGRFKESISINQGLLALGNVISALSDEKRKGGTAPPPPSSAGGVASSTMAALAPATGGGSVHVPYRDSKLTRLLQDSLGGNAKTLMIACVSPAAINFEETLNTLKYANRAKKIKNRPIVNQQTQEEKQKNDDEITRMKEEIALLQSQLQLTSQPTTPSTADSSSSSRPETSSSSTSSSSSSSSRHRRHSVAVSTSTSAASMPPSEASMSDQEASHLRKKCRAYAETIETMRSLSVEAITSLVAMEREIKPLGRPVQQRLNEIVKTLNAAVQAVGHVEASLRKSLSIVPGGSGGDGTHVKRDPSSMTDGDAETEKEPYARLAKQLKEANANLARDEQIFEMKNAEINKMQAFISEAKLKNEKLIQRVQELERSGQLWSNPRHVLAASAVDTTATASGETVANSTRTSGARLGRDEESTAATFGAATSRSVEDHPARTTASSGRDETALSKRSTSSRGLFTKRTGTAAATCQPQEDNVLIGNEDDDSTALAKSRANGGAAAVLIQPGKPLTTPTARKSVTSSQPRGSTPDASATTSHSGDDAQLRMTKMDKMLATLRGKVEELQQQNGELLHSREESVRRWQLERQQYERQLNEAEQTVESLREVNQSLEDTLLERGDSQQQQPAVLANPQRMSRATTGATSIVMDEDANILAASPPTQRPKTSNKKATEPTTATTTATTKMMLELFDTSVRRLIEYNHARQQVVHLIKDKQAAQQNADDTNRRLNALEMLKLRQSMQLRESIADVSASLRAIKDKIVIHHDHKTQEDELARLEKLRDRAERKLKTLRRQEQQEAFLDHDSQQEVVDLEELLDDLNSHIAFQDAELASAREDMELLRKQSQLDEQSPLDSMTQALVHCVGSGDTAAELLPLAFVKKCLEDIARLRARERELADEISERQAAVAQRDASLCQLENGLVAAQKEFDRRLQLQSQESQQAIVALERQLTAAARAAESKEESTKLQPVSLEPESASLKEEEWHKLIVSCQKKDEYITTLEKHVVFYKSKAKQMQMQLQQLIRDSAGNQNDHGGDHDGEKDDQDNENLQLQKRIEQLEEANDVLMKDLATAKVYLRQSKSRSSMEGAQMVRISKSELRELPRPPTSASSRDD